LGWYKWADLQFYSRLIWVYYIGQQFYTDYPGLTKDIVSDPTLAVTLDVYRPLTGTNHPVIIYLHGGVEQYATKELFAVVGMKLVTESLVVVIPDYTLYPKANYRQMGHEASAAISWTLTNIKQYGGDPRRVVLVGHSSGAYLGALIWFDAQYLAQYNHTVHELCGFISVAGVYDLLQQYAYEQEHGQYLEMLTDLIGDDLAELTIGSPIHYIQPNVPPILLIHGTQDETFPIHQASRFQQALTKVGAPSRLQRYPQAGHTDFLFKAIWADQSPFIDDLVDFVARCPN